MVDEAIASTSTLLEQDDDPLLQSFLTELRRYRQLLVFHSPLTDEEKAGVDIGRVAVRELDETWPDHAAQLSRMGAFLRTDGHGPENDPAKYRPELPSSNRSHAGELKTDDYFGP